jgi:hypothetical protein
LPEKRSGTADVSKLFGKLKAELRVTSADSERPATAAPRTR